MKSLKSIFLTTLTLASIIAHADPASADGVLASTSMPTFITSMISGGIHTCKEELKNVEVDAYDFMAGEPMTLALQLEVDKLRDSNKELMKVTDEQLVNEILKVLNESDEQK